MSIYDLIDDLRSAVIANAELMTKLAYALDKANEVIKNEYPEEQWVNYGVADNDKLIKQVL